MPMDSVIEENVKIMKEHSDKEKELEEIKETSIEKMWLNELSNLKIAYNEYINLSNESNNSTIKKTKKK